MKISLVIFDLDGTLINSAYDLADAVNESLTQLGYPIHDINSYYQFVGDGTLKLCERALPADNRDDYTIDKLHTLFSKKYIKCCMNKTIAYDGIPHMLDKLLSSGVRCAVASNKTDEFAKEIVYHIFGEQIFDMVCGKKSDVPCKPSPEIVLDIISKLGTKKSQTIFVGDSDVDVFTAHNSGIKCIGCEWGFRGKEELVSAGADYIVNKPIDILNFL